MTEHERFWSKVDKTCRCWIFTGYCNPYGQFRIGSRTDGSRRWISAHVYAFEEKYGELVNGEIVCHTCDNPPCVRPSHLFAGTYADNIKDMMRKGRARFFGKQPVDKKFVERVLILWNQGVTQIEIANLTGVHKQKVWRCISGVGR